MVGLRMGSIQEKGAEQNHLTHPAFPTVGTEAKRQQGEHDKSRGISFLLQVVQVSCMTSIAPMQAEKVHGLLRTSPRMASAT